MLNIVPTEVDKNARQISQSQRLRSTLPKPRRRQLALVLLYNTTNTSVLKGLKTHFKFNPDYNKIFRPGMGQLPPPTATSLSLNSLLLSYIRLATKFVPF